MQRGNTGLFHAGFGVYGLNRVFFGSAGRFLFIAGDGEPSLLQSPRKFTRPLDHRAEADIEA